jgi:hypothetical protein
MEKERFLLVTKRIKLSDEIKLLLDKDDVWLIENIGFPNQMVGIPIIFIEPIIKDNLIILGHSISYKIIEYGIDINSKNIIIHNNKAKETIVFVNTTMKHFLSSSYSYETFIRRLIELKSLGAYYDNSGGNHEKYACLLEDIVKDIDERAVKEGVWYGLIGDMKLGVI